MLIIKKRRMQQGMKQKDLAKQANISAPYLSELEDGKKRPSIVTIQKLAAALNCTIDELVEDEGK